MAVKVYGLGASPYVVAVEHALKELGVDYEFVVVNVMKGEARLPEYLEKNPFGQIPFFEDGDVKLYQSPAIIRYVADRYAAGKGPGLYGNTLEERAMVEQWLEVCSQNYIPPAIVVMRQTAFGKIARMNKEQLEQSFKELERVFDIYDQRLQSSKYLAGDFFSLADLAHMPHTYLYFFHGESDQAKRLINDRKHVKAWWEDITARPAWKKVEETCTAVLKEFSQQ